MTRPLDLFRRLLDRATLSPVTSIAMLLCSFALVGGGIVTWAAFTDTQAIGGNAVSSGKLSAPGTPASSDGTLRWAAADLRRTGGGTVTYHVERRDAAGTSWEDACGSTASAGLTATECAIEPAVASVYRVTAHFRTWTARSSDSATVPPADTVAPTVDAITLQGDELTSSSAVSWKVTFSEPVSGVDAGDFALEGTGASGASIASVTGSAAEYTVAVDAGADGTLALKLVADGSIKDPAGNVLGAGATGDAVRIDRSPPFVQTAARASASPTAASTVSWTYTFSEPVSDVGIGDFEIVASGLTGAPAITGVTGSGATYTVSASTGSGSGTLAVHLKDDDSILDAAGNALGGTGTGNGDKLAPAYTIDRTAPAVAITAPADGATVARGNVTVTATGVDDHLATLQLAYRPEGATWVDLGGPGTTSPHSATWNTGSLAAGSYELRVTGVDSVSNSATATRTVTVPPAPCTAGTVGVTADRDTWIDQRNASASAGTLGTMDIVASRDTTGTYRGDVLVGFAPPTIPSGCTVTKVELQLFLTDRPEWSQSNAHDIAVHRIATGSTWSEATTWATAPAAAGTPVALAFSQLTALNQTYSWDVTGLWSGGATNGFRISNATTSLGMDKHFRLRFATREATAAPRPRLVFTYG